MKKLPSTRTHITQNHLKMFWNESVYIEKKSPPSPQKIQNLAKIYKNEICPSLEKNFLCKLNVWNRNQIQYL